MKVPKCCIVDQESSRVDLATFHWTTLVTYGTILLKLGIVRLFGGQILIRFFQFPPEAVYRKAPSA